MVPKSQTCIFIKLFCCDLPHTTISYPKWYFSTTTLKFLGIFFSDSTWFYELLDFTVTTHAVAVSDLHAWVLQNCEKLWIWQKAKIDPYPFSNRFKQLWHNMLWRYSFLRELTHFWFNPSSRVNNRVVLPVVPHCYF